MRFPGDSFPSPVCGFHRQIPYENLYFIREVAVCIQLKQQITNFINRMNITQILTFWPGI